MVAAGAKGHPDADLARAARHSVRHQAIETEARQQKRQRSKETRNGSEQSFPQQRLCGLLRQRFRTENRKISVHGSDFPACFVEQVRSRTISHLEGNKSPPVLLIPTVL